jgi:hypothetical protein
VPAQLTLDVDPGPDASAGRWADLPPATREQVLVLLARLIAHDVLAAGEAGR